MPQHIYKKYNRTFAVPQIDIRQTSLTLTLTNYAKHRLVQFHNVPKRRTTEAKKCCYGKCQQHI